MPVPSSHSSGQQHKARSPTLPASAGYQPLSPHPQGSLAPSRDPGLQPLPGPAADLPDSLREGLLAEGLIGQDWKSVRIKDSRQP